MNLTFHHCTPVDLQTLRELAYSTYNETFAHMNTPEVMQAYLSSAFSTQTLNAELNEPNSAFYILYADSEPAGYLKLNEAPAQSDINDPQALELQRIYVAQKFQGRGLGSALMGKALELAMQKKKTYIWLGVWQQNEKAIAFYKRKGFFVIGTHPFMMGGEEQTDYVMRRDL